MWHNGDVVSRRTNIQRSWHLRACSTNGAPKSLQYMNTTRATLHALISSPLHPVSLAFAVRCPRWFITHATVYLHALSLMTS